MYKLLLETLLLSKYYMKASRLRRIYTCLFLYFIREFLRGFPGGSVLKTPRQETRIWSLGWKHHLKEDMAIGLQDMGVAKELDMTEGLNSNNNEENFSRCLHQSLVLIQNIAHLIKDLRRKTTKYSK